MTDGHFLSKAYSLQEWLRDKRWYVGLTMSHNGGIVMINLVLLRHGESIWNKENRFTGWADVDLSEKGIQEAKQAGKS